MWLDREGEREEIKDDSQANWGKISKKEEHIWENMNLESFQEIIFPLSGVAKSRTRLSDFTFTFHFHALEKEMATHFSVLAWRIPGTGEPGGLPSLGSHRVGHDWRDLAAAAASFKGFFRAWRNLHSQLPSNWGILSGNDQCKNQGPMHQKQQKRPGRKCTNMLAETFDSFNPLWFEFMCVPSTSTVFWL